MNRMDKVNSSIKRELAPIIDNELRNTNITGLITINKVDTSPDFSKAKIYISMLGVQNRKEALKGLRKAKGYMKIRLAKLLNFRKTPDLQFIFDESVEYGTKINKIIRDLNTEDIEG
ncbi:MAG: 30S ribosome-binding factor RbfA [Clostridium sp.]